MIWNPGRSDRQCFHFHWMSWPLSSRAFAWVGVHHWNWPQGCLTPRYGWWTCGQCFHSHWMSWSLFSRAFAWVVIHHWNWPQGCSTPSSGWWRRTSGLTCSLSAVGPTQPPSTVRTAATMWKQPLPLATMLCVLLALQGREAVQEDVPNVVNRWLPYSSWIHLLLDENQQVSC